MAGLVQLVVAIFGSALVFCYNVDKAYWGDKRNH